MKNLIYGILCMLALGTVSCFKDNTTLGAKNVGDIEIGKLSDATVVLFVGFESDTGGEARLFGRRDGLCVVFAG